MKHEEQLTAVTAPGVVVAVDESVASQRHALTQLTKLQPFAGQVTLVEARYAHRRVGLEVNLN